MIKTVSISLIIKLGLTFNLQLVMDRIIFSLEHKMNLLFYVFKKNKISISL